MDNKKITPITRIMIVYKTTNLMNGKIYVGQDSKNDKNYLGSGDLIKRAIKKYGKLNFKKETLVICHNQTELNEAERFWIKELKTVEFGYNIALGGTNGTMLNRKHTENTRQLIRDSREGIVFSDKHKENLRLAHIGKTASNETKEKMSKKQKLIIRKPMSEETKEKIRNSKKGVKASNETKEKMSKSHTGVNNHFYGKTHSVNTIKKISETKTGVSSKKKGVKYV
jgi:group I intron endonuclease